MRTFLKSLGCFALGALAFAALLELIFRLLPAMHGLKPDLLSQPQPLHSYEPHRAFTYSYGWDLLNAHRGSTNNYGHIAPFDFQRNSRPLIVVGDSFVESLMNNYADTVQGVLGRRLAGRTPVYGLGVSGMSLSDYAAVAMQAATEFQPRAAVVLVVDGDIAESYRPREGGHHLQPAQGQLRLAYVPRRPNALMQSLRRRAGDLALLDYLRGNLKFSPADIADELHAAIRTTDKTVIHTTPMDDRKITDWFVSQFPQLSAIPAACVVLLFDADRYAIYDPKLASRPKDDSGLKLQFMQLASAAGFQVIDLAPVFARSFADSKLKLDYWPIDRHWNAHGHEVAANAALSALQSAFTDNRQCLN